MSKYLVDFLFSVRCILNFGHTIGHAIETLSAPQLLHGEAVSIGMILESKLSQKMGYLSGSTLSRIFSCCQNYNLPVKTPPSSDLSPFSILEKMTLDKKNANNEIRCVILKDFADPFETPISVPLKLLRYILFPQISVVPMSLQSKVNKAAKEEKSALSTITLTVPGSKSLSNRALPIIALGQGTTRIRGLLMADDTLVMLDSLKEFGVQLKWEENNSVLKIEGKHPKEYRAPGKELFLGNAGTASR